MNKQRRLSAGCSQLEAQVAEEVRQDQVLGALGWLASVVDFGESPCGVWGSASHLHERGRCTLRSREWTNP